jgi:amino acid transporter
LGPAALLPFLISAVLCSLLVFCFAEMGSRFESTGGPILYAREAFGDLAGFSVGWMTVLVRIATWGALANAFVTSLATLVPGAAGYRTPVLVGLFASLAAVNCAGMRSSARATNFFTLAKLLPMVLFVVVGAFHIDPGLYRPFAPQGYSAVGAGTLVILFAFVGFEVLPIPAGEAKDPKRDMPRALLISMSIITLVYLGIWAVCAGTLPTLAGSAAPVSEAATVFLGPRGSLVIDLGILMSVVGVNLAVSITASRCVFALGVEGEVPRVFGRLHGATGAPVPAILLTSALSMVVALSGTYVELAVLSVLGRFTQYIPTVLAMMVLRRRGGETPSFKVPLGPVVPVLALALCGWLISQAEVGQLLWGAVALAAGMLFFLVWRRLGSVQPR